MFTPVLDTEQPVQAGTPAETHPTGPEVIFAPPASPGAVSATLDTLKAELVEQPEFIKAAFATPAMIEACGGELSAGVNYKACLEGKASLYVVYDRGLVLSDGGQGAMALRFRGFGVIGIGEPDAARGGRKIMHVLAMAGRDLYTPSGMRLLTGLAAAEGCGEIQAFSIHPRATMALERFGWQQIPDATAGQLRIILDGEAPPVLHLAPEDLHGQ